MKKVAAIVKGEKIYESEVEACKEYLKRTYQRQRKTPFTEEEESHLKEQAKQLLIQMKITRLKAKELKFDQFTKEEEEKIKETAKKQWDESMDTYISLFQKKDPKLTKAEAEKLAKERMAARGYTDSEPLYHAMLNQEIFRRVQRYTAKDITVSDEEARQLYEKLTERDKKAFEGKIPQYESVLARYGNVVYYIPEGYRLVKHIRLMGDENRHKELRDLLYDQNGRKKKEVDEEKVRKLRDEILQSVQEKTDEIRTEYEQGTPFEKLMETYSLDKKTGWNIHTESIFWEQPVIDAVKEMKEIGELSAPAVCSNGIFLFRYEADTKGGVLPFTENVLKNLKGVIYRKKANDQFVNALKQWSRE